MATGAAARSALLRLIVFALFGIATGCVAPNANAGGPRDYLLLVLNDRPVRWIAPAASDIPLITYGFASQAQSRPGARNCREIVPFESRSDAAMAATFRREVAEAFAVWSRVSRVRFVEAPPDQRPDVIIGAQASPRGIAYADVAFVPSPQRPFNAIDAAAICFDLTRHWTAAADGDPATFTIRTVAIHEVGHVLGLDHVTGRGQIMDYKYQEALHGPQAGDIAGIELLYGARDWISARSTGAAVATTGSSRAVSE